MDNRQICKREGSKSFYIFIKILKVNKKWLPIAIVLLLAVIVFFIKQTTGKAKTPKTTTDQRKEVDPRTDNVGLNRSISLLKYSEHSKCRMDCRHISQHEVEEIMLDGKINYNKSDLKNARCPRYA